MKTSVFDFILPESHIAHYPVDKRDESKLLYVQESSFSDLKVKDLENILSPNDVLVFNDTKVIPARLFVTLEHGALVEILLHQCSQDGFWKAFARPAKKLRIGQKLVFAEDFSAIVQEKYEDGQILLIFNERGNVFWDALERYGHIPLPPYIKRRQAQEKDSAEDKERYQTVYAQHNGSVAAPTAGLHFTEDLLHVLAKKGIEQYFVTLHVGAGTFQPVKAEDIEQHTMHAEYGIITQKTADALNQCKHEGKRIIAIGTTSLRILESATDMQGVIRSFNQETNIFITPGYHFRFVDCLFTNFHLPKSTLFMLVSAFSGVDHMKQAYAHAIKNNYRFYSYGDACLLEKSIHI